jgi:DNA invertase Pin-like site-specific DNA recombinase
MTKKVVFYARANNDGGEGSIEAQIERGKGFIGEKGWTFVTAYSDIAVDGAVFKRRPGIQALFAHLKRERVDVVLCDTVGRLSRRTPVVSRALDELRRNEAELWAVDPGAAITGRNLLDHLAADEAAVGRTGQPAVEAALSDPDTAAGTAPLAFGYGVSEAHDPEGRRIFGFRVVDPRGADIVRRIFGMYADGMSARDIAGRLNAEGVEGPRGKAWREAAIRGSKSRGTGILNNPLYIGQLAIAGRPEPTHVPALRIVSDELWARARERDAAVTRQAGDAHAATNRKPR